MAAKSAADELLVEHERSFHSFVRLVQVSIAGIITILVLMAIFLL
jgi:CHASE1-domain containing sensor protein